MDINIQWLVEQGWNPSLDRLRYSEKQLFIRRFDPSPQKDFCLVVQLTDSMQLTCYGNDENLTEFYFRNMFVGGHLEVKEEEMDVIMRGWVDTPHGIPSLYMLLRLLMVFIRSLVLLWLCSCCVWFMGKYVG